MSGDGGGGIEVELQGRSIKWSDRSKVWKEEDAKEVHDFISVQRNSHFCWGGGISELYKIVDFLKLPC